MENNISVAYIFNNQKETPRLGRIESVINKKYLSDGLIDAYISVYRAYGHEPPPDLLKGLLSIEEDQDII